MKSGLLLLLIMVLASGCITTLKSPPLSSMSDEELLRAYYQYDAKVGYYERESLATQARPSWGLGGVIASGMSAGISEGNADSYRNKKIEALMELRKRGISQFNETAANIKELNQDSNSNATSRDTIPMRSDRQNNNTPVVQKASMTQKAPPAQQSYVIEQPNQSPKQINISEQPESYSIQQKRQAKEQQRKEHYEDVDKHGFVEQDDGRILLK